MALPAVLNRKELASGQGSYAMQQRSFCPEKMSSKIRSFYLKKLTNFLPKTYPVVLIPQMLIALPIERVKPSVNPSVVLQTARWSPANWHLAKGLSNARTKKLTRNPKRKESATLWCPKTYQSLRWIESLAWRYLRRLCQRPNTLQDRMSTRKTVTVYYLQCWPRFVPQISGITCPVFCKQ